MNKAWKRMSSGKYIDLNNLKPEDINIEDIETSLNNTLRFNGHYKDEPPLNVAQHSLLCLNIAHIIFPDEPELYKAVFTHDFSEAYIGDISSPVKKSMGQAYKDWVFPIEDLVERVFIKEGVDQETHDKVKLCDLTSLDIERRVMWRSPRGKDKWPIGHINLGTYSNKEELWREVSHLHVPVKDIWETLNGHS